MITQIDKVKILAICDDITFGEYDIRTGIIDIEQILLEYL